MAGSPYQDAVDRLSESNPDPVVALPDGSVDRYRTVHRNGERVTTREAFGRQVADGTATSYRVTERDTEPGGQAVNAARQAESFGAETYLYGHLDHPVFDSLEPATWSFGTPATVEVYPFDDGSLLFSTPSADLRSWSVADLRALESRAGRLGEAGVAVVTNWLSVPAMGETLRALPSLLDGGTVVFDPGDVTGADAESLAVMTRALGALDDGGCRAVLDVNAGELDRLAAFAGAAGADVPGRLRAVRDVAGVSATVLHGVERAAVATRAGSHVVPNLSPATVRRRTGAGDRFGGALAFALADDWPWEPALALGNAAATHYVSHADTAGRSAIESVADRPRRD